MYRKSVLRLLSLFIVIFIFTISGFIGCKVTSKTETTAAETTAAETTAAETTAAETTTAQNPKDIYTYEKLREMAKAGKYEGEPAKGHTMAFANFLASFPFCKSVEDGIKAQWKLADGADSDLTVLDNAYDINVANKNVDVIFSKKPEVFLQFFFDAAANAMTGRRAQDLGIYIIAIDIPVPGFPFMGVDNYGTSVLTGNWAVEQIDKVYGGWDNVDRVFFLWVPEAGDTVKLRMQGAIDVFKQKYAEQGDPNTKDGKALLIDSGSTTDETKAAITDILAKYPKDKNFVVFTMNDQAASGVQSAAELAGRWDPDKWLIMSQGLDDLGISLVRDGVIDGDSAYFPEKYGEYLIPSALAHIYGNPVPPYMFVENVIITKDNIDEYYPKK